MKYYTKIIKDREVDYPILALDFDGPIHKYSKGWEDGIIYDVPTKGVEEALIKYHKKYIIVIFTVRENYKDVIDWLKKNKLIDYIDEITNTKPFADLYVDDRGITFNNWDEVNKEIDKRISKSLTLFGKALKRIKTNNNQLDLFITLGTQKEFAPGDVRKLGMTKNGKKRWMDADEKRKIGETIVSAATKTPNGKIFTGTSHPTIYANNKIPNDSIDGFMTSKNRFVSREEASLIAKKSNQISSFAPKGIDAYEFGPYGIDIKDKVAKQAAEVHLNEIKKEGIIRVANPKAIAEKIKKYTGITVLYDGNSGTVFLEKPTTINPEEVLKKLDIKVWHRGVNTTNEKQIDKFYSASKEVASNYSMHRNSDERKYEELKTESPDFPKKPLVLGSKDDLAYVIGFNEDPYQQREFDNIAKTFAEKKGYDAIIYLDGTFDEPELHLFGEREDKFRVGDKALTKYGTEVTIMSMAHRKGFVNAMLPNGNTTTYKEDVLDKIENNDEEFINELSLDLKRSGDIRRKAILNGKRSKSTVNLGKYASKYNIPLKELEFIAGSAVLASVDSDINIIKRSIEQGIKVYRNKTKANKSMKTIKLFGEKLTLTSVKHQRTSLLKKAFGQQLGLFGGPKSTAYSKEGQTKQGRGGTLQLKRDQSGKGAHWRLMDKKQSEGRAQKVTQKVEGKEPAPKPHQIIKNYKQKLKDIEAFTEEPNNADDKIYAFYSSLDNFISNAADKLMGHKKDNATANKPEPTNADNAHTRGTADIGNSLYPQESLKLISINKAYDILSKKLGAGLSINDKSGNQIDNGSLQLINVNNDNTISLFYKGKNGETQIVNAPPNQAVSQKNNSINFHFADRDIAIELNKPKNIVTGQEVQNELPSEQADKANKIVEANRKVTELLKEADSQRDKFLRDLDDVAQENGLDPHSSEFRQVSLKDHDDFIKDYVNNDGVVNDMLQGAVVTNNIDQYSNVISSLKSKGYKALNEEEVKKSDTMNYKSILVKNNQEDQVIKEVVVANGEMYKAMLNSKTGPNYLKETLYSLDYKVEAEKIPELQEIKRKVYGQTTPGKKVLIITGGLAGSGKSTAIEKKHYSNKVYIDPDDIKNKLYAEERGVSKDDIRMNPAKYHEESSVLGKHLIREAIRDGRDAFYDATMKGIQNIDDLIKFAKSNGYKVQAKFVHIPLEEGIKRDEARGKAGGRSLGEKLYRKLYQDYPTHKVFFQLQDKFDHAELIDNSQPKGQKPQIIQRVNDGKVVLQKNKKLKEIKRLVGLIKSLKLTLFKAQVNFGSNDMFDKNVNDDYIANAKKKENTNRREMGKMKEDEIDPRLLVLLEVSDQENFDPEDHSFMLGLLEENGLITHDLQLTQKGITAYELEAAKVNDED